MFLDGVHVRSAAYVAAGIINVRDEARFDGIGDCGEKNGGGCCLFLDCGDAGSCDCIDEIAAVIDKRIGNRGAVCSVCGCRELCDLNVFTVFVAGFFQTVNKAVIRLLECVEFGKLHYADLFYIAVRCAVVAGCKHTEHQ